MRYTTFTATFVTRDGEDVDAMTNVLFDALDSLCVDVGDEEHDCRMISGGACTRTEHQYEEYLKEQDFLDEILEDLKAVKKDGRPRRRRTPV